jgi:hypothetical protein
VRSGSVLPSAQSNGLSARHAWMRCGRLRAARSSRRG